MENWKCPIEYIDEDIREVVRVLYVNNMKPYMSCSGSYKDHEGKSSIVQSACLEMLDSELTRNFMAALIKNKRFKCTISKEKAKEFYDNNLPTGFRFKIDFENVCGDASKDLQSALEAVINGKDVNLEDRKRIDAVCELLEQFDVSRNNSIAFSFNDEMITPDKSEEDNYSITIQDKKDFTNFKREYGATLTGFIQTQERSRFLGNDYITMLAFLKKLGIEYSKVPLLKAGQKAIQIADESRIDKFMASYAQKSEAAKAELESKASQNLFESTQIIDFEDLLGIFQVGDNNDDGAR